MELEERLQKLSKHSEHRRTFTLSRLAVFYAVANVGQTGSTPVHGCCDMLLHTGSSRVTCDITKRRYPQICKNKQVDNMSIFSVISVPECG